MTAILNNHGDVRKDCGVLPQQAVQWRRTNSMPFLGFRDLSQKSQYFLPERESLRNRSLQFFKEAKQREKEQELERLNLRLDPIFREMVLQNLFWFSCCGVVFHYIVSEDNHLSLLDIVIGGVAMGGVATLVSTSACHLVSIEQQEHLFQKRHELEEQLKAEKASSAKLKALAAAYKKTEGGVPLLEQKAATLAQHLEEQAVRLGKEHVAVRAAFVEKDTAIRSLGEQLSRQKECIKKSNAFMLRCEQEINLLREEKTALFTTITEQKQEIACLKRELAKRDASDDSSQ